MNAEVERIRRLYVDYHAAPDQPTLAALVVSIPRLLTTIAQLLEALKIAKTTIRTWHSIRLGAQEEPGVWQHYQASPEMRAINQALGGIPKDGEFTRESVWRVK